MLEKLYIIVRRDLEPGPIVAQTAHAATQIAQEHPELFARWYASSRTIVVLEAADEDSLCALVARAAASEVPHSVVREPDYGDSVTAVALGPAGARLVSSLRLAFRQSHPGHGPMRPVSTVVQTGTSNG